MWNGNTGEFLSSFMGHERPLTAGRFTPDGSKIITISEDTSLRIWKPMTGELLNKI